MVTFPTAALRSQARIALGADLSQSYLTWNWLDITARVRWDEGIEVSAGRREQSDRVDSGWARLKADNRDGYLSRKNAFGPHFGLLGKAIPLWLTLDPGTGFADRYFGFLVDLPKRWDRSATDSTIFLTARGLLHLLLRRQPLRSPMFYSISGVAEGDYVPSNYWPCEDGPDSTQIASALVGHAAVTPTGTVDFAVDGPAGSAPLMRVGSDFQAIMPIAPYTDAGQWFITLTVNVPTEPASTLVLAEVPVTGGTVATWRLQVVPGAPTQLEWRGFDSAGVWTGDLNFRPLAGIGAIPSESDYFGTWYTFTIGSEQDGSNVLSWLGYSDGAAPGNPFSQLGNTAQAGTHSALTGHIRIMSSLDDVGFGHVATFVDPNFDPLFDGLAHCQSVVAWSGERAHQRIARLCREQRISLLCNATTSARLGPQPTGTLIEVLRDAEKADQGVLYEHQFGLAYQANSERYNQPVAMTIDVAQGQVAEDLEPDDNDLRFHNQWTAKRSDGSEATVQGRDGNAGEDLEATDPIYDAEDTFGVETDAQLPQMAGWLVHRDSLEDDYWPNVAINLATHPELIDDWLAMGYGQRVNVTNVMDQAGIDTIDVLREGHTERWNSREWLARMNTAPAATYTVGELDDTSMRLDSSSSTLDTAAVAGAASLSVATSDSRDLWSTDAGDYPQDVTISGIHVTVTAVSGSSSPQTFTVTGATVVKDLHVGDEVHVRYPFVLAL